MRGDLGVTLAPYQLHGLNVLVRHPLARAVTTDRMHASVFTDRMHASVFTDRMHASVFTSRHHRSYACQRVHQSSANVTLVELMAFASISPPLYDPRFFFVFS